MSLNSPKTDFRQAVYQRYVSGFKSQQAGPPDYEFSNAKLLPILAPILTGTPRTGPVLDLGCGAGVVLHAMKTLGFQDLTGVDTSPEQIALARQAGYRVEQQDLFDFLRARPENYYSAILMFDVIEHLYRDEILELMDLIFARLRGGGVFVAHCPNGDSPLAGSIFAGDLTHVTLLNACSARCLCDLAGLTDFSAHEHLGASADLAGRARAAAWQLVRLGLRMANLAETGSGGSNILTRQFFFKARKA